MIINGKGSGTESEALKEECRNNKFNYRGTLNKTVGGRTCQRWDSHEPHIHEETKEMWPYKGLSENYCRNPLETIKILRSSWYAWCYTTDPQVPKEECQIETPCYMLKWCELSGQEFSSCVEGTSEFEDLDTAKTECLYATDCTGITQLIDGTYGLTTGVAYPTDKPVYGLTLQKGACKELDPPVGVHYEKKNIQLTDKIQVGRTRNKWDPSDSFTDLREAKQLCTNIESCKGISGKDGAYNLYSNQVSQQVNSVNTWFKGECP